MTKKINIKKIQKNLRSVISELEFQDKLILELKNISKRNEVKSRKGKEEIAKKQDEQEAESLIKDI